MRTPELYAREPSGVRVEELVFAEPPDVSCEGFDEEAFAILGRLREHPHIEQYRSEKEGIRTFIREPFKRYRDDLVVNWVLPSRLAFETEKNVFSRLLKNDFGAGGCHHHLWMAFYRPPRKRLTDVQLSHSITPDGFEIGLFAGGYARKLLRRVLDRLEAEPERFLALVNPLLQEHKLAFRYGAGEQRTIRRFDNPLSGIPDELFRADALWVRRQFPREAVLSWGGDLVRHALNAVCDLWPMYRFLAEAEASEEKAS